eukprot:6210279-Pleurochrysis_carterae.AAC.2
MIDAPMPRDLAQPVVQRPTATFWPLIAGGFAVVAGRFGSARGARTLVPTALGFAASTHQEGVLRLSPFSRLVPLTDLNEPSLAMSSHFDRHETRAAV